MAWFWYFYKFQDIDFGSDDKLVDFKCSKGDLSVIGDCPKPISLSTNAWGSPKTKSFDIDTETTVSTLLTSTSESTITTSETTIKKSSAHTSDEVSTTSGISHFSGTYSRTTVAEISPITSLICEKVSTSTFHIQQNRIYSHTSRIRNNTLFLDFYIIEDTPYYEIKINDLISISTYLIWMNTNNASLFGCYSTTDDTIVLGNLQFSNSYILCVVNFLETKISPFDCTSLNTPQEYPNQPWIRNRNKVSAVALITTGTCLIVLICCLLTYYCTKINQNNQESIKHESVPIQGTNLSAAMIMPNFVKPEPKIKTCGVVHESYPTPTKKPFTTRLSDIREAGITNSPIPPCRCIKTQECTANFESEMRFY